ncbi:MAG: hypothetical protein WC845_03955 [Candidatus Staskawiczbacteria bacterium]|jgi:hypothetical protein
MKKNKKVVKKITKKIVRKAKPKNDSKGAKKKRQEMVDYIIKKLREL